MDLKESIESTNQQREITQYIEDYAVLEQLGSGAFGSVCKVRKRDSAHSQTYYALKEVSLTICMYVCDVKVHVPRMYRNIL